MKHELVAIVGPTASGKTRRAVELATHLNGEIISGDSRQVYRGMDLGTGKDLAEYGSIPYHLIDICEAGEKYNLFRFVSDFKKTMVEIESRNHFPILCGGSGMYVEAALNGIVMPEVPRNESLREELKDYSLEKLTDILRKGKSLHNKTDVDTVARALRAIEIMRYYEEHPEEAKAADIRHSYKPDSVVIGLDISRDDRRRKISERLKTRLDEGMIDEIKGLIESGVSAEDLIYYGLEYKFVTLYVIGQISYEEMFNGLEIAIHQFAKRQMTWWRGMEKRGHKIHWLPYNLPTDEFIRQVDSLL